MLWIDKYNESGDLINSHEGIEENHKYNVNVNLFAFEVRARALVSFILSFIVIGLR